MFLCYCVDGAAAFFIKALTTVQLICCECIMCKSRWLKLLYLPAISEGKYVFISDFVSCYSVIFMHPAYSYSVSVRARLQQKKLEIDQVARPFMKF